MSSNRLVLALGAALAVLGPMDASAQIFVSSGARSGVRIYDRGGAGTDFWLDPSGGKLKIMANSVEVASITTAGYIYASRLLVDGAIVAGGGSGINADLLDGLDSTAFGDATAANQTTILSRIGTSADSASLTPTTLFAGVKGIIGQVDNAYSAGITLMGIGSAPSCPSGWTEIVGQTSAGTMSPLTSINTFSTRIGDDGTGVVCTANSNGDNGCGANSVAGSIANGGSATTYTLYYRVCALPR